MALLPAVFVPTCGSPMDHLSSPRYPMHGPVEMPYLCADQEYDGGPFLTYPYRRGWTTKDINDPANSGKSADEVASFFQNWFFFGLLADILRKPISTQDFVRINANGQEVITTKHLPEYISEWINRERRFSLKAQEKYSERVDKVLWHFCTVLGEWTVYEDAPLDPWTALSFNLLGEYMDQAYQVAYAGLNGLLSPSKGRSPLTAFSSHLSGNRNWSCSRTDVLAQRMRQDQWCPSEIQRLSSTIYLSGKYYASNLRRPIYEDAQEKFSEEPPTADEAGAGHTRTDMDSDESSCTHDIHRRCSDFSCSAYQYNPDSYETKHVSDACNCKHIPANMEDLISILEKGLVPVVFFYNGLRIMPASSSLKYVAISHVWSDRLGNPKANSLPYCQLVYISRLVNELYGKSEAPIGFWIDTLCCPTKPEEATDLAIDLMRKTYEEADAVLVLDSYLQSKSLRGASIIEIFMMIHCSRWNRRLWTLQERVLAKNNLFFQFDKEAVGLEMLQMGMVMDVLPEDIDRWCEPDTLHRSLAAYLPAAALGLLKPLMSDTGVLNINGVTFASKVMALQRLLPFRATSVASDEPLCIGSLLNLDMMQILRSPKNSRMEKLWSLLPEHPPDVIFWNGKRLSKKGFRWAPASLLGGRDLMFNELHTRSRAHLTSKGLNVQYPGWLLGCNKGFRIKGRFHMLEDFDSIYMVSCFDSFSSEYLPIESSINPWDLESGSHSILGLALISRLDFQGTGNIQSTVSFDSIMVLAYGHEEAILFVTTICPVTIRKLNKEDPSVQKMLEDMKKVAGGVTRSPGSLWCSSIQAPGLQVIDFVEGFRLGSQQQWCVD